MTFNRKNKILIFCILVAFFIVYKIAISKTFKLYGEYNEEIAKHNLYKTETIKINKLENQKKQIDKRLKHFNRSDIASSYNSELFKFISEYCENNNLSIVYFDKPLEDLTNSQLKIINYKFTVEGSFNHSLMLANHIENSPYIGKMIHFLCRKKINQNTKEFVILTDFIIEKKFY
jgi:hypothetical protein